MEKLIVNQLSNEALDVLLFNRHYESLKLSHRSALKLCALILAGLKNVNCITDGINRDQRFDNLAIIQNQINLDWLNSNDLKS